jgi:hypothetical protein
MKYVVKMGSGAMIYIPSFLKIGSDIHKLRGRNSQTHRQLRVRTCLRSFYQNKKSRLKRKEMCQTRVLIIKIKGIKTLLS